MLKVRLVFANGKRKGKRIAIQPGAFFLGRHQTCNLRLKDSLISRWHCVFLQDEEQLVLTDLGSQNGSIVNGHRLGEGDACRLQHHDELLLGESRFRISVRDADSKCGVVFRDPASEIELVALSPEQKTRVTSKSSGKINFDHAAAAELDANELLRELEDMVGKPEGRRDGDDSTYSVPRSLDHSTEGSSANNAAQSSEDATLSTRSPTLDTERIGRHARPKSTTKDTAASSPKDTVEPSPEDTAGPSPADIAARLLRSANEDE